MDPGPGAGRVPVEGHHVGARNSSYRVHQMQSAFAPDTKVKDRNSNSVRRDQPLSVERPRKPEIRDVAATEAGDYRAVRGDHPEPPVTLKCHPLTVAILLGRPASFGSSPARLRRRRSDLQGDVRVATNTSREPSGDHAGYLPSATLWRPLPSAQRRKLGVRADCKRVAVRAPGQVVGVDRNVCHTGAVDVHDPDVGALAECDLRPVRRQVRVRRLVGPRGKQRDVSAESGTECTVHTFDADWRRNAMLDPSALQTGEESERGCGT